MKNVCLISTLVLCCQLLFINFMSAQDVDTPEDGPPQGKHVLLVDDPDFDCNSIDNYRNGVNLNLLAINLLKLSNCPAARLQIREESTNIQIGLSDIISFDRGNNNWMLKDHTEDLACHDDPTITYYQKTINVSIDLSAFICYGEHSEDIEVIFEYVEATPNSDGEYHPYFYNNSTCMFNHLSPQCLDHAHHTEPTEDGTLDPNPPYALTDGPSDFLGEATLCFNCDPGGFVGQGKSLGINTNNQSSEEQGNSLNNTLSAYPNPFKEQVFINYNATNDHEVLMEVRNLNGAIIQSQRQFVYEGSNSLAFRLNDLVNGIYILRVWDGKQWNSKKLLKAE